MENLLNFIPVIVLLISAILFRIQQKSWLAPSSFFLLIISAYVILPLIFAPYYVVWHLSIWWIVGCALCLGIGASIGMGIKSRKPKKEINIEELVNSGPFKRLKLYTILSTVIGFLGLFYYLSQLGLNFSVFLNIGNLGYVSSNISNSRYNGEYSQSAIYNVALSINYAAGFLGGMLMIIKKSKIAFLPFVPIILTTALSTTKVVVIFIIVFWLAGFFAAKVYTKQLELFTFKKIFLSSVALILVNVIFIASFMLRYNWTGMDKMGVVYEKLTHYYFGYLSAYSQWFKEIGHLSTDMLMGQMTFAGVWDLLGKERVQGMYDKFTVINPDTGSSTNIYTFFRFLIDDFGLVGSLILFFIAGFIVGLAYRRVLNGRIIFMPILILFYAQTLIINTTSTLAYNTLLIAWIGVSFYLVYISYPKKVRFVISNNKQFNLN